MIPASAVGGRSRLLRRAVHLESLTLGWNLVEGVIAVTAALAAGSVALFAFGIDSFVECASGGIMLWRLLAERKATSRQAIEALETRARKLVALSLFALAAWVLFDAGSAFWRQDGQSLPSWASSSRESLWWSCFGWPGRSDRAAALKSRALEADAFQTTACWWLSLSALAGVGLNALFGWWWADPVSALVIVFFLGKEGREAWKGEDCCNDCH